MLVKKYFNTKYEGTTGRVCPTYIIFNGTKGFGIPKTQTWHTISIREYRQGAPDTSACTFSNTASSILDGESYTNTVAFRDIDYTTYYVKALSMSGVKLDNATYFIGNEISIPIVTGDISILLAIKPT